MTNQQRNVINKDLIVNRIIEKTLDESGSKLVKRIIRQVKNSRKKPKTYLNIDEKQLNHLLFELIKKWQKSQISSSVDKFLAVIKDSWKMGDNVILWGLFSSQVYRTPSRKAKNPKTKEWIDIQAKNRLKFRVSSKLKREINN